MNEQMFSYEQVARWLPQPIDPKVIEDWIGNKSLFSQMLPETLPQLFLEQAAKREELRGNFLNRLKTAGKSQSRDTFDLVNPGELVNELGRICRTEQEIILLILDGLEPEGIQTIGDLATVISPAGIVAPTTKVVAEVEVDLGLTEKQKIIIPPDDIVVLPIPVNTKARLKIKLNRDLRLNRKGSLVVDVIGGRLGVILDLRGRPITLPVADNRGRERVRRWRESLGIK